MIIEFALGIVLGFVLVVILYNFWRHIFVFAVLILSILLITGIPAIVAIYLGYALG